MNTYPTPTRIDGLKQSGRPRSNPSRVMSQQERKQKNRDKNKQERLENVATLDFETNPFDNKHPEVRIFPFACCLYTEQFGPFVIWDENPDSFIKQVLNALDNLPGEWTIYAHNGGKFDFMFLMPYLTGKVQFIGRAMVAAKIGRHKLRDSLKILPIALKEYNKDDFDYTWLLPKKRNHHKQAIIDYMVADCRYLHEMVTAFIERFGMKLTVGQAAFGLLKEKYPTLENLASNTDATLRPYFHGGRVECVQGIGRFVGPYKLFDVNSMYPDRMANCKHPVGADLTKRTRGGITKKTCLVEVECEQWGAFPTYAQDGSLSFVESRGTFFISVHEFHMAEELGLMRRPRILSVIDCDKWQDFADFILPLYEERFFWKGKIRELKTAGLEGSEEYYHAVRQDLLVKFILNTGYGKFAQNPRRFKDSFVRPYDRDAPPPEGYEGIEEPAFESSVAGFEIWEKPTLRQKYNNVATACSITGAARAKLLHGLHRAINPIYADTDSIICYDLPGEDLHPTRLGAWDLEAEFTEVLIGGKKLYCCRHQVDGQKPKDKVRSKGVSDMSYDDLWTIVNGGSVSKTRIGVTIGKDGSQSYLTRIVRATANFKENRAVDIFGRRILEAA